MMINISHTRKMSPATEPSHGATEPPDFDTFSTIFRKSLIINIVLRPPKFVVEKRYELTMLGGEKKGFC